MALMRPYDLAIRERLLRRLRFVTANRISRNKDLFASVLKLALNRSPEARRSALQTARGWLMAKQLDSIRRRGMNCVKGFPSVLLGDYPEFAASLEATPHLGALASLAPVEATRLDYALLHFELLLGMKERHPGIGLGSSKANIEYNGESLTGLAIAQLWAILLNVGHLFGTFSTERALLFYLDGDSIARDEVLDGIDPRLRPYAARILQSRSMYRFFHLLSAWRVSQESLPPAMRETCIAALNAYLGDANDATSRLKTIFKKTRQLAYLTLHSFLGIGSLGDERLAYEALVEELVGPPGITFQPHAQPDTPIADVLDALENFHYRVFFTSGIASFRVLTHLREFKRWWTSRNGTVTERIRSLFRRPHDWPQMVIPEQRTKLRLDLLGTSSGWVDEVQAWAADETIWQRATFFVSHSPSGDRVLCDVYSEDVLPPAAAHHVAQRLASHCTASWDCESNEESKRVWRSAVTFGAELLEYALRPEFRVEIDPSSASAGSIGYALIAPTLADFERRLRVFLSRVDSIDRRRELEVLLHIATQSAAGPGCWFAFLGKTQIVDRRDGRVVQELDGVWALIDPEGIAWHAVEVKRSRLSGARGQLMQLQARLLPPLTGPIRHDGAPARAIEVNFSWPFTTSCPT